MKRKIIIFQGIELNHNVNAGVILTDHSLVLQSVTRAAAGDYTCLAANTEGKGTSNPVTLRIRCKFIIQSCIILFDQNFNHKFIDLLFSIDNLVGSYF